MRRLVVYSIALGIVVANIDTGVQWDHPALIAQYRGSKRTGVNHNYSWFDPSNVCGDPSVEPCDNVGHGTHTMGTLVGDDGGANEIGVAPRCPHGPAGAGSAHAPLPAPPPP